MTDLQGPSLILLKLLWGLSILVRMFSGSFQRLMLRLLTLTFWKTLQSPRSYREHSLYPDQQSFIFSRQLSYSCYRFDYLLICPRHDRQPFKFCLTEGRPSKLRLKFCAKNRNALHHATMHHTMLQCIM